MKFGHSMVQIISPHCVKVKERGWVRQWRRFSVNSYVFIVVVNTRNQDLRAMSLLNDHIT